MLISLGSGTVMASSYYDVLGVTPDSETPVIEAAYRALMKRYHPDVRSAGDSRRSAEINEAYAVLRDPRKRMEYDEQLGLRPKPPAIQGGVRASTAPRGKDCPDCGESLRPSARICRFCGYEFWPADADEEDEELTSGPPPRRSPWKTLLAVGGVFFLLWLLGVCSYSDDPGAPTNSAELEGQEPVTTANGRREQRAAQLAKPEAPASDWDKYEDDPFGARVLWRPDNKIQSIQFYRGKQRSLLQGCTPAMPPERVTVLSVDDEQGTFRGRTAHGVSTFNVPFDQVPEVVASWVRQMTEEGATLKVSSAACGASGSVMVVTGLEYAG